MAMHLRPLVFPGDISLPFEYFLALLQLSLLVLLNWSIALSLIDKLSTDHCCCYDISSSFGSGLSYLFCLS